MKVISRFTPQMELIVSLYVFSTRSLYKKVDLGMRWRNETAKAFDDDFHESSRSVSDTVAPQMAPADPREVAPANGLRMLELVIPEDSARALQAVRDGLKKVRLKNVKNKADMKMSFESGILEMHCAYALRTDGMFSDGDIRNLLMQKL